MTLIVTTSWDDGAPDDATLVDLLVRYQVRGTLYVPRGNSERPVMSDAQLRDLAGVAGVEIGSHTLTHRPLTALPRPEVRRELVESRRQLEDLLGRPVPAFCFPRGAHRRWMRTAVAEAGYRVGRTTMSHRVERAFDPLLMPTTAQFYPHRRRTYLRHAVREANVRGLGGLLRTRRWRPTATDAVVAAAELARRDDGVLHVWGHSWEITEQRAWAELADLLALLGSWPETHLVTNGELAEWVARPAPR